jgi:hypothetical protein
VPRPTPKVRSVLDVAPSPPDAGVWRDGAMTVRQAAEFMGMGRNRVFALMKAGELVWSKPGQARLVSKVSCQLYLARHQRGGS